MNPAYIRRTCTAGSIQPIRNHLLPPSTPEDSDHDGYIEDPEAEAAVGPPVFPLGDFAVDATGMLKIARIYTGVTAANLFPRTNLTFELHGLTVPDGAGEGTPNEVNGTGGYKMELPIGGGPLAPGASPEAAVPEPATYGLCGVALAFLAVARRRLRA